MAFHMQSSPQSTKQVLSICSSSSTEVAVDTQASHTTKSLPSRCSMLKITDPADKVYYIEDRTDENCPTLDPLHPFSTEDEAVRYAIDVMGLSVLDFNVIGWSVD